MKISQIDLIIEYIYNFDELLNVKKKSVEDNLPLNNKINTKNEVAIESPAIRLRN